jgi:hypothetical protein
MSCEWEKEGGYWMFKLAGKKIIYEGETRQLSFVSFWWVAGKRRLYPPYK